MRGNYISESIGSFFELPYVLLLVPLLIFFLLWAKKRFVVGSSQSIFALARAYGLKRLAVVSFYWLAPFLVLGGVLAGVAALAGPRSTEQKSVERMVRGRVAVIIDDTSGSMIGGNLNNLQKANRAFLQEFCQKEAGEELSVNLVGLVTFAGDAMVRMPPTRDCDLIRRRIDSLAANGETAIEKGLWTGLLILLKKVDHGRIIPLSELKTVSVSLKERIVVLPQKRKEFCEKYSGLSLLLFTDGDFPAEFSSRDQSLRVSQTRKSNSVKINPFNVIDLAKSLCIRTYFWSVSQLDSSYKEAFSSPPGTGFAVRISDLGPDGLSRSYKEAARKEAGQLVTEKVEIYHPLRFYFMAAGLVGLVSGTLLAGLKNFLRHSGGEARQ